jgi:recombination protein RecA
MSKEARNNGKLTIQEALNSIEKKHGAGTIMRLATGAQVIKANVLKTGIWSIDKALGGGLVKGRIIEVYGNEASGKTTLALQAIVQAQQSGRKAAFIDVEHAFSMEYAQSLGVDLKELFFAQPDSAEAAFDVAKTLAQTGEFAIIVLDSIAALVPATEYDGEVGKSQMGNLARFLSIALKQVIGEFSRTDTIFLLINQLRTKIGIAYGNPEYTTGGNALKYYTSQRIMIRRSSKIEDTDGNVIGYTTLIRIEKNKIAMPHQKTEVEFYNGIGFDAMSDMFHSGVKMGVIYKEKVTYYVDKTKLGVGEKASKLALSKDSALQALITAKLDAFVSTPVVESEKAAE